MADIRGVLGMDCNDKCGCTVPCPGGVSCKCSNKDSTASRGEHKTCTCGQHLGATHAHAQRVQRLVGLARAHASVVMVAHVQLAKLELENYI
ncbi:ec protein iii [Quercus suber]|uniref:Ec protein iii n=1 Tax=Quercus suber TaxID=58331 RepID=A0AAW0LIZ2_QUESU